MISNKTLLEQQMKRILLSGAYGQVGMELFRALSAKHGAENVICSDIKMPPKSLNVIHHEIMDIHNKEHLFDIVRKYQITDLYCLAALLSATGERYPLYTENINMTSLFNCLEAARYGFVKKVFWPSSIAAFGTNTPKKSPQFTVQQPGTVYGITKKNGELWCNYYYNRYGVDVRSVRYPGLVGWRSPPGGGTTDYAVDIFHKAIMKQKFTCYLHEDTPLSMVYTDDAIDGTLKLMEAEPQKLTIRTSYNIQAMHFTPKQIATEIKKHIPDFEIIYQVEPLRQSIAESWPQVFMDEKARKDWGWSPQYDLPKMVAEILKNLTPEIIESMRPVRN